MPIELEIKFGIELPVLRRCAADQRLRSRGWRGANVFIFEALQSILGAIHCD